MKRQSEFRLTLYKRKNIFWVSGWDRAAQKKRYLSLNESNPVIAKAKYEKMLEQWRSGEKIFPDQFEREIIDGGRDDLIEKYINSRKAIANEKTRRVDKSRLFVFAEKAGVRDWANVTAAQVEGFFRWAVENRSWQTYNHFVIHVRMFFEWLVKNRVRRSNPVRGVALQKKRQSPIKFLTKNERGKVISASKGTRYHGMIAIALGCGLRLGELQRLKWADVDFKNKIIVVKQSKSGKMRAVPMPKQVVQILRVSKRNGKCGFFCFSPIKRDGKQIRTRLKGVLQSLEGKSGVSGLGWNVFRHTFASLLVQKGVSIFKVSQWLGHASVSTTMRHYATLAPGYDPDVEM